MPGAGGFYPATGGKKKCLHKISRRILNHHGVSKPFFLKGLTPAQAKAAKYGNISLWWNFTEIYVVYSKTTSIKHLMDSSSIS